MKCFMGGEERSHVFFRGIPQNPPDDIKKSKVTDAIVY